MRVDPGALGVLNTLREAGFRALLAGGCVRDMLMGIEPKDWDIATDAGPEQVEGLFSRTLPVGAHFGICVVLAKGVQMRSRAFAATVPMETVDVRLALSQQTSALTPSGETSRLTASFTIHS